MTTIERSPAECCRLHDVFVIDGPSVTGMLWIAAPGGFLTGYLVGSWGGREFHVSHERSLRIGMAWRVTVGDVNEYEATLDRALARLRDRINA